MLPIGQIEEFPNPLPFSFKDRPFSFSMSGRSENLIQFSFNIDTSSNSFFGPHLILSMEAFNITFTDVMFHFAQPIAIIMAQCTHDEQGVE